MAWSKVKELKWDLKGLKRDLKRPVGINSVFSIFTL